MKKLFCFSLFLFILYSSNAEAAISSQILGTTPKGVIIPIAVDDTGVLKITSDTGLVANLNKNGLATDTGQRQIGDTLTRILNDSTPHNVNSISTFADSMTISGTVNIQFIAGESVLIETNILAVNVKSSPHDTLTISDIVRAQLTNQDTSIKLTNQDTNVKIINPDTNVRVVNLDTNVKVVNQDTNVNIINQDTNVVVKNFPDTFGAKQEGAWTAGRTWKLSANDDSITVNGLISGHDTLTYADSITIDTRGLAKDASLIAILNKNDTSSAISDSIGAVQNGSWTVAVSSVAGETVTVIDSVLVVRLNSHDTLTSAVDSVYSVQSGSWNVSVSNRVSIDTSGMASDTMQRQIGDSLSLIWRKGISTSDSITSFQGGTWNMRIDSPIATQPITFASTQPIYAQQSGIWNTRIDSPVPVIVQEGSGETVTVSAGKLNVNNDTRIAPFTNDTFGLLVLASGVNDTLTLNDTYTAVYIQSDSDVYFSFNGAATTSHPIILGNKVFVPIARQVKRIWFRDVGGSSTVRVLALKD